MQTNFFQDAYFGKPYRTRDGRKALYVCDNRWDVGEVIVVIEGSWSTCRLMKNNGHYWCTPDAEYPDDVISEWEGEISEDELDNLAFKYADKAPMTGKLPNGYNTPCFDECDIAEAYKAGFHDHQMLTKQQ